MDNRLITFLKVVETGTYTQTAELLHLTQPAVSIQIKKLEEEYNCKLFQLKGRSLYLTDDGELLHQFALKQKASYEEIKRRIQSYRTYVNIGMTLSIADYYIPSKLFVDLLHEGVQCHVDVNNTERILQGLKDGSLDCAFVEGLYDTTLFEAKQACKAKFVGVVRSDHPLANRKVKFHELFNYPLVLREKGSGTRAVLENYLLQTSWGIESFAQQSDMGCFRLIKDVVKYSDAITFVYDEVVASEVDENQLQILDIEDMKIERVLMFLYDQHNLKINQIEQLYDSYMESR